MGRVLRMNGNGKIAMVIDPHFSGTHLAPLSTPQLFLPPGRIRSGQVIVGRGGCRVGGIEDDDLGSPYFPKGVDPTIVEIKPIETIPPGDEDWKTAQAWAKEVGLSRPAVNNRVKHQPSEQRRGPSGRIDPHYHRSVVMKACADLLNFKSGDLNWNTANGWCKEFGISARIVCPRLKSLPYEDRRDPIGKIRPHYQRSVVVQAFADLFSMKSGDADWKTSYAWAQELNQSAFTMNSRLNDHPSEQRRAPGGSIRAHYHRSVVMKACDDLFNTKHDHDDWKTSNAWAQELNLSDAPVRARLTDQPNEQRRDLIGHTRNHYHRSVVMKACADLLNFESGDANWNTSNGWAKVLNLSPHTTRTRLNDQPNEQRRDPIGHTRPHYHRSIVLKACADLIAKRKKKR
jgi:hypothetical protein